MFHSVWIVLVWPFYPFLNQTRVWLSQLKMWNSCTSIILLSSVCYMEKFFDGLLIWKIFWLNWRISCTPVNYRIDYKTFNRDFSRINPQQIKTVNGHVHACKRESVQRIRTTRQSHDKPWIFRSELTRAQWLNLGSAAYAQPTNNSKRHWNAKRQWNAINEILTNKTSGWSSIDAISNKIEKIVSDKEQIF